MHSLKRAAAAQGFATTNNQGLRRAVKPFFLAFGLAVFSAMATANGPVAMVAAGASLTAALAIVVGVLVRQRSRSVAISSADHYWFATAFAAALLGAVALPASFFLNTAWAMAAASLVGVLALLAGATSFCLGRFVYVVVLGISATTDCD